MSTRNDRSRADDIIRHAREAVAMMGASTLPELEQNRMLQLALLHLIVIVGEAAHHLPAATLRQSPSVPWRNIVGMRNHLVHGYNSVRLEEVHRTIRYDMPSLIAALSGTADRY